MVKNIKNSKAFSLAEAIMSIIIISVVVVCVAPILTKQRPGAGTNPTSARGAFLCYYSGGQLHQDLYNERKKIDQKVGGSSCKYTPDKRGARYYYIAAGAGSTSIAGQVATNYVPDTGEIEITPGVLSSTGDYIKDIDDGTTKIKIGSATPQKVLPGYNNTNGLILENIKKCKLNKGTVVCPSGCDKDENGNTIKITGCEPFLIEEKEDDGTTKTYPGIHIKGCQCDEVNKEKENDLIVKLENITNNGSVYNGTSEGVTTYEFNFDFYDSSYGVSTTSHMKEILNNVHDIRQGVYDDMMKADPGAPGKNGAAAILW